MWIMFTKSLDCSLGFAMLNPFHHFTYLHNFSLSSADQWLTERCAGAGDTERESDGGTAPAEGGEAKTDRDSPEPPASLQEETKNRKRKTDGSKTHGGR